MAKTSANAANQTNSTKELQALAARAVPLSARCAIVSQHERSLDIAGASAKIEFANYQGSWVAEFRFRLRSGLYQACTLPLTTSSARFSSLTQALADAGSRLIQSLNSAIEGATLSASQERAVAGLSEWAHGFIDLGLAEEHGPLAGARFLDIFAGVGGFHIALASQGAQCAGAIEIDAKARQTYRCNHLGDYPLVEDVRTARGDDFGRVDIVCGGFPCQSFSQAGSGAGFSDPDNGALFFDLARLIGELSPSVAILENVAGLATHDDGNTFETVSDTLAALGYSVSTQLLNAGDFGLPQMRERLFMVCVHDSALANRSAPFVFPKGADASRVVADILETKGCPAPTARAMKRMKSNPGNRSKRIEVVGLIEGMPHQGYRVASTLGKGFTLCASSGGVGGKTGLYLVNGRPRALSARESARMQGFPESFSTHATPGVALRQFGNSVAIPVVASLAKSAAASVQRNKGGR